MRARVKMSKMPLQEADHPVDSMESLIAHDCVVLLSSDALY